MGDFSVGEDAQAEGRCGSTHRSMRCVGRHGHPGPHWAPVTGSRGVRWGLSDTGCIDGMEVGLVCRMGADHEGPHRDLRGRSWGFALSAPSTDRGADG